MADSGAGSGKDGHSSREIAELVRSIASVMHQSDVSELDLDVGGLKLRLRRPQNTSNGESVPAPRLESASALVPSDDQFITAPMIGTFYASPSPGTSPFVVAGDVIEIGQSVGIIEAMKIMNEISADRAGIVDAVLVENGQPVEYGTPLFRLAAGTVTSA